MNSRLPGTLAVTLGYLLVATGGATLAHLAWATAPIISLGLPAAARSWIGWSEIGVGLLLVAPRLHRPAGVVLALGSTIAAGVHLRSAQGGEALVAGALAAFGLVLARAAPRPERPWLAQLPAPLLDPPARSLRAVLFVTRAVGVAFLVRWAVGGILFWAALPVLGWVHARRASGTGGGDRLRAVLLYLLFYGFGVGGLWNFVGHVFMADAVADSVGWAAGSPFQTELGFYALGTGLVALMTPWWRDRYWVAAALAPSVFVYGAAFVHIRDYLVNGNDAPMNWGPSAVGANLLIPTAVLGLVWACERNGGFERGNP